jgi:hypothetical protein
LGTFHCATCGELGSVELLPDVYYLWCASCGRCFVSNCELIHVNEGETEGEVVRCALSVEDGEETGNYSLHSCCAKDTRDITPQDNCSQLSSEFWNAWSGGETFRIVRVIRCGWRWLNPTCFLAGSEYKRQPAFSFLRFFSAVFLMLLLIGSDYAEKDT